MNIKTDFDLGQSVYRVVIDPHTFLEKTPTYVALEFVIDKITITKKCGVTYHCKRNGSVWHGWVFGSNSIFLSAEDANSIAAKLNKQARKL